MVQVQAAPLSNHLSRFSVLRLYKFLICVHSVHGCITGMEAGITKNDCVNELTVSLQGQDKSSRDVALR